MRDLSPEVKIMKKLLLSALVISLLAITGCQNPQSNVSPETTNKAAANNNGIAGKADPKVVEEVKGLLARHDKALNEKNIDDLLKTFSTDPNTVVLGTGEGERFVGQEAIRAAYTEIFKDYDVNTVTVTCDWKTGGSDPSGTVAWMAATCPSSDSLKGVKREYFLNVSAAAVKAADGWHFVMLHLSNITNGPPPPSGTNSATAPANAAQPANAANVK